MEGYSINQAELLPADIKVSRENSLGATEKYNKPIHVVNDLKSKSMVKYYLTGTMVFFTISAVLQGICS